MERRYLGAGLMVLASSFMLMVGTASAHEAVKPQGALGSGTCTVKSLPSFIAQGEFEAAATVGDVIEVSCDPYVYSDGAEVTLTAAQLYDRCGGNLSWGDPNDEGEPIFVVRSRSFSVHLDVDGNANVALLAGPGCMVGESLISVDEDESPYETFTTAFQVLPDVNTTKGLYITPSSQVEDAGSSSVVTIAQAEFPGNSEKYVRIGAKQLNDRCRDGGLLIIPSWINVLFENYAPGVQSLAEPAGVEEEDGELLHAIELDNNGNGFVILAGIDSCAEGTSLVEADLEESPFSTETATFTVEAPRPERFAG